MTNKVLKADYNTGNEEYKFYQWVSGKDNSTTISPSLPSHEGWREESWYIEDQSKVYHHSIKILCDYCGDRFLKERKLVKRCDHHFCKEEHRIKWLEQGGSEHPAWDGGESSERGSSWYKRRTKAYERDNGKCQDCGMDEETHVTEHGRRADVHHIIPYKFYDSHKKSNKIENLVTLCTDCHRKHERWANHVAESQGFK